MKRIKITDIDIAAFAKSQYASCKLEWVREVQAGRMTDGFGAFLWSHLTQLRALSPEDRTTVIHAAVRKADFGSLA